MSDQQSPAAAESAGTPKMPEGQSPAATGQAPPPKKGVSPARNAIGLIVLLVVGTVGVLQYMAMGKFNATLNILNTRMDDESKDLMSQSEAETLIGKAADDAGSDFHEGTATYTRKTYTWWAPLKSYTLTAYYTRGTPPALHHTESEGAKYVREEPAVPPAPAAGPGGGAPPASKARTKGKKSGEAKGQEKPKAEAKGEEMPKAEESSKTPEKSAGEAKAKADADEPSKTPSKP